MSVINQMLKDLERRQAQVHSKNVIASMPSHYIGPFDNMSVEKKSFSAIFFSMAILLLVASFLWKNTFHHSELSSDIGVELPNVFPQLDSQASQVHFTDTLKKSNDIAVISAVKLRENTESFDIIFESNMPFVGGIVQRFNNDEIIFEISNAKIDAHIPILDGPNAYFSAYGLEQKNEKLVLSLVLKNQAIKYASALTKEANGKHNYTISLRSEWPKQAKKTTPASKPKPIVKQRVADAKPAVVTRRAVTRPVQTNAMQAEAHYQHALSLLQVQRLGAAIEKLSAALILLPSLDSARILLAELYLQKDKLAEAYLLLNKGMELNPSNIEFASLYARSLVQKNQLLAAERVLVANAKYAVNNGAYSALQAAISQRLGRHAAAIAHYTQALEEDAANGTWWMGMAISLEALNQSEDAQQAYKAAYDSNDLNAQSLEYVESRISNLDA